MTFIFIIIIVNVIAILIVGALIMGSHEDKK